MKRPTAPVWMYKKPSMVDWNGTVWYHMVDPREGVAHIEDRLGIALPASAVRSYLMSANQESSAPVKRFIGKCTGADAPDQRADTLKGLAFIERFQQDPPKLIGEDHGAKPGLVGDLYRECRKRRSPVLASSCVVHALREIYEPEPSRSGYLVLSMAELDHIVAPVADIKDVDALRDVREIAAAERIATNMCRHQEVMCIPPDGSDALSEMCGLEQRKSAVRVVSRMALCAGATQEQVSLMIERILE